MFHLHSLTFEFQCLHAYLYIELSSLQVLLVKFIVLVIVIWISIHSIYTYSSQFLYCLCRIELNYSAYINCQWIDNFICMFSSVSQVFILNVGLMYTDVHLSGDRKLSGTFSHYKCHAYWIIHCVSICVVLQIKPK